MPADARREPPPDAGHGHGRPPDGQLEEGSWAIARGLKSIFGWQPNTAAQALPPLTLSGLRAGHEHGQHDGGVHRPAAPTLTRDDLARPAPPESNGYRRHRARLNTRLDRA